MGIIEPTDFEEVYQYDLPEKDEGEKRKKPARKRMPKKAKEALLKAEEEKKELDKAKEVKPQVEKEVKKPRKKKEPKKVEEETKKEEGLDKVQKVKKPRKRSEWDDYRKKHFKTLKSKHPEASLGTIIGMLSKKYKNKK